MNDAPANVLNPETVLAEMKKHGVTHVVYLPDSETNWLYLLMKADPAIRLVGVNREGHASSIAAGPIPSPGGYLTLEKTGREVPSVG